MDKKIKIFTINEIKIIYAIRLDNDKIVIVHKDEDKKTELVTDNEFFERYKRYY